MQPKDRQARTRRAAASRPDQVRRAEQNRDVSISSVWYKQTEGFARKTIKEPLFGAKISSFSFKSDHVFRGPES
jgi:hypothetical protein